MTRGYSNTGGSSSASCRDAALRLDCSATTKMQRAEAMQVLSEQASMDIFTDSLDGVSEKRFSGWGDSEAWAELDRLAKSDRDEGKLGFLEVIDRIALRVKHRVSIGEVNPGTMASFINAATTRITARQGFCEKHLAVRMFDIVLSAVVVEQPMHIASEDHSACLETALLSGRIVTSPASLSAISIQVWGYLWRSLNADHTNVTSVRIAVLALATCRCNSSFSCLEHFGGLAFYENLLQDLDPHVALIASSFLVSHLQATQPEEFPSVIRHIVRTAQYRGDAKVLHNPYLMMSSLLPVAELAKAGHIQAE